jgi:Protein of unknown function (DUF3326)
MMTQPFKPAFWAAMIIPTGVGATIGGFGGDATPEMNLLASVCDGLLVNPNVANAAIFQRLPGNALYVEGSMLDRFFAGALGLRPVRNNKMAVILDAGVPESARTPLINTIHAMRSVWGLNIPWVIETAEPLKLSINWGEHGQSTGAVDNIQVLMHACEKALSMGAEALALCVFFPEALMRALDKDHAYEQGHGVDPIGGIEAMLSHAISVQFHIPCAHAPVFDFNDAVADMQQRVDPRAASEVLACNFLPSVLMGLAQSPKLIPAGKILPTDLGEAQVQALIVPHNALGAYPVMRFIEQGKPVIAVQENTTICHSDTTAITHLLGATTVQNSLIPASTYYEAAGILAALRLGLTVPFTRSQTVHSIVDEFRFHPAPGNAD